jgi:hypothetical protein
MPKPKTLKSWKQGRGKNFQKAEQRDKTEQGQ